MPGLVAIRPGNESNLFFDPGASTGHIAG